MPEVTTNPPGSFCWIELTTSDGPAAKAFYASLFGWQADDRPISDGEVYTIFQKNGRDAAAMYQNKQMPPHWASYICVTSADESAALAKSLGGSVMMEPFDVMDVGRMAVVADPQGAVFALWQPKRNAGLGIRDEANTLCWNELYTRDAESARKFYTSLFGWTAKVSPQYTEWHLGERGIGGMFEMNDKDFPGVPPHWIPYFMVDDCDATAAKMQAGGGAIRMPPTTMEHVGRIAIGADPQGAGFAIIKLMMHA